MNGQTKASESFQIAYNLENHRKRIKSAKFVIKDKLGFLPFFQHEWKKKDRVEQQREIMIQNEKILKSLNSIMKSSQKQQYKNYSISHLDKSLRYKQMEIMNQNIKLDQRLQNTRSVYGGWHKHAMSHQNELMRLSRYNQNKELKQKVILNSSAVLSSNKQISKYRKYQTEQDVLD